ncbi:endolytic transglycosylase MltG [Salinithrix halophila]|uniref:Endolytic murein transglycosylase n=1 Tax=Salinithrix halophila TaxID=1485204 RepID=A0ABV8JHZ7_9BACL
MKWILRLVFTLVLFTAFSALGYWYIGYSLSSKTDRPVKMEVLPGTSIFDVGKLLEEKQLIRDDLFFAVYAYLNGQVKGVKAGMYEIPPGSDAAEIMAILTEGSPRVLRLTVPEGTTVEGIADRLETKGVDREAFLQAVDRKEYPYAFLKEISRDKQRRHRLEGYLYPTTYNLPKGSDPDKLVGAMLQQFQNRLQKPGVREKLKERGLTVDEWVTLASILEREGRVRDELPRIAGVIYNRLRIGKKLQVDATVQYALGEQKSRLYFKDLKVKSPYNTYQIKGLPPGAIANPGKKALNAALNPEKHPYLFYVTRKDGSGLHYFARTDREHQQNIKKSKRQAAKTSGDR